MSEFSRVIIGAGLAGSAAALLSPGDETTVVLRATPGATATGSGFFGLLPYATLAGHAGAEAVVGTSDEELAALMRRVIAHHPLNFPGALDDGAAAAGRLVPALARAGLVYTNRLNPAGLFARADGVIGLASFVPASMAGGELRSLRGTRVGIVCAEHIWPPGADTPAALNAQAGHLLENPPQFEPVRCDLRGTGIRDLAALAAWVRRSGAAALADTLRVSPGLDALGLPAIETRLEGADSVTELADLLGLRVFEMAVPAPSAPAFRLSRALEGAVAAHGVRVLAPVTATSHRTETGRVFSVRARGAGADQEIAGETFILATGANLGGGIRGGLRPRESVFGLPLTVAGDFVSQLTARDLGPRRGLSVIPAFTAGVRVDEQGRPLSESGSPAYGNLRACGSVVAACGHDGGAGLCLALAARATASVPA